MQEMTITSVHALGPRYAVILKEKDADCESPRSLGQSSPQSLVHPGRD